MIMLIPGRHHVITRFQAAYLFRFFNLGMDGEKDSEGQALGGRIDKAIFAVTSADHASTRRNPLPYALRAMAIHSLGEELHAPVLAFGIDEAGARADFAEYTLKTISHASEGELVLSPENCVVACSTDVGTLYRRLGFRVWKAEADPGTQGSDRFMPWDIIESIAAAKDFSHEKKVLEAMHPASFRLFMEYSLGKKLHRIFSDPLLGGDGDLTATRDYGSYVRQMDENADFKWQETKAYVKAGRIGDIGCAVGSWLARACKDIAFLNSDFYGIEITRALYDICLQRRHNGDFGTPNIWFAQRNAVEGQVFQAASMTTIHSSSLTHEIESYAGRQALLAFIRNRYSELESGGVWINRDVIGPEAGDQKVIMELSREDGLNPPADQLGDQRGRLESDHRGLHEWLQSLSTAARFLVFARDFRAHEAYQLAYSLSGAEDATSGERLSVCLSLRDACEYMLTKDYCDNWQSEMHETFCHWSLEDWKSALTEAGFSVSEASKAWTNPWIVENRWLGKLWLKDLGGKALPWPPTNALILAIRE